MLGILKKICFYLTLLNKLIRRCLTPINTKSPFRGVTEPKLKNY